MSQNRQTRMIQLVKSSHSTLSHLPQLFSDVFALEQGSCLKLDSENYPDCWICLSSSMRSKLVHGLVHSCKLVCLLSLSHAEVLADTCAFSNQGNICYRFLVAVLGMHMVCAPSSHEQKLLVLSVRIGKGLFTANFFSWLKINQSGQL